MSYIENYVYSTGGLEVSFSVPCKHKNKIHSKEYTSNTKKIFIWLSGHSGSLTRIDLSGPPYFFEFFAALKGTHFYIVFIG